MFGPQLKNVDLLSHGSLTQLPEQQNGTLIAVKIQIHNLLEVKW